MPKDACVDSFDMMGALLGDEGAQGREHLVQQDNGRGGNYGFRVGDWKLQRHDSKRSKNSKLKLQNAKVPQYRLFNVADDPAEKVDLSSKHPEVKARLVAQLAAIIEAGRSRD